MNLEQLIFTRNVRHLVLTLFANESPNELQKEPLIYFVRYQQYKQYFLMTIILIISLQTYNKALFHKTIEGVDSNGRESVL